MHLLESFGAMAIQTQVRRSKPLNTATLILNALAFPLLVPAALISTAHSGTEPAAVFFSFIPLSFSLCLAVSYIALQKRQRRKQVKLVLSGDHEQGRWWLLFPIGDFLVFGGFLTMLIVMWVREPRNLSNDAGSAFFEAYATAPLVANMFIHFFFFAVNSYVLFRAIIPRPGLKDIDECPHCHRQISSISEERSKGKGKEEGYSLLRGEDYDNDARRASEEGADAGEALIREV